MKRCSRKAGRPGRRSGSWLIGAGVLLIGAAVLLSGYNLWDGYRAQRAADALAGELAAGVGMNLQEVSQLQPGEGEAVIPDYVLNPNMEMPVQNLDGRDFIGMLEIPALNLELPIVSQWSYDALRQAPCRYTGSAYQDNLVIAAHNYQSHFGSLQKLAEGELVRFTDVDGNVFEYEVAVRETLPPTAIEEMTSGEWDLTLFTCTYGGQYRVTVRCEKIL